LEDTASHLRRCIGSSKVPGPVEPISHKRRVKATEAVSPVAILGSNGIDAKHEQAGIGGCSCLRHGDAALDGDEERGERDCRQKDEGEDVTIFPEKLLQKVIEPFVGRFSQTLGFKQIKIVFADRFIGQIAPDPSELTLLSTPDIDDGRGPSDSVFSAALTICRISRNG
jgi:hypothetical protein